MARTIKQRVRNKIKNQLENLNSKIYWNEQDFKNPRSKASKNWEDLITAKAIEQTQITQFYAEIYREAQHEDELEREGILLQQEREYEREKEKLAQDAREQEEAYAEELAQLQRAQEEAYAEQKKPEDKPLDELLNDVFVLKEEIKELKEVIKEKEKVVEENKSIIKSEEKAWSEAYQSNIDKLVITDKAGERHLNDEEKAQALAGMPSYEELFQKFMHKFEEQAAEKLKEFKEQHEYNRIMKAYEYREQFKESFHRNAVLNLVSVAGQHPTSVPTFLEKNKEQIESIKQSSDKGIDNFLDAKLKIAKTTQEINEKKVEIAVKEKEVEEKEKVIAEKQSLAVDATATKDTPVKEEKPAEAPVVEANTSEAKSREPEVKVSEKPTEPPALPEKSKAEEPEPSSEEERSSPGLRR